MLDLNMRPIFVSACLFFAALAPGQTAQTAAPNAVKLTKYILGVADLDKSYAFYHALGLDLQNNAPALTAKPNTLNDALRGLVDVPPGTKFRNMMLKIPNAPFPMEVTEFTNMDVHAAKPRIQDPGASLLVLDVDDMDAALAAAKKAGGEVVTTGGAPVKRASGAGPRGHPERSRRLLRGAGANYRDWPPAAARSSARGLAPWWCRTPKRRLPSIGITSASRPR